MLLLGCRLLFSAALLAVFVSAARPSSAQVREDAQGARRKPAEVVPGEILIKFRERADAESLLLTGAPRPGRARLRAVIDRFRLRQARPVFPRSRSQQLDRVLSLRSEEIADSVRLQELLRELKSRPEVEYAEPNLILMASLVPDDPYFGTNGAWGQDFEDLWGLQKIQAPAAWDRSLGANVTVAVLDTGIDFTHPDIDANLWQNAGEIGTDSFGGDKRSNAVDDDLNGYIDDWRGWDFISYDNDPVDDFGHGTHVAGTIAALGENATGLIGIAPLSRVMSVKVLDRYGYGYVSQISSGIVYAAANGARVLNMSLGGYGETPQTLVDAIAYAHDVKSAVVVVAAGNSGDDVGGALYGEVPANIRDAVAVSAFNHTDAKASFSNFGAKIDVAAPGGGDTDATGTIYQPGRSILSLLSSMASSSMTGAGALIVGGDYLRQSGTSMAAPHVSGAAALILALHPELTSEQVRQALRAGSDDVGTSGFDLQSGYGRLNASGALDVGTPLGVQLTEPTHVVSAGEGQATVVGTVEGPGLIDWRLEYGAGALPTAWNFAFGGLHRLVGAPLGGWDVDGLTDGDYTLRLVARDASGREFEDRLVVSVDSVSLLEPSPASTTLFRGGGALTIAGTVEPSDFASYAIRVVSVRTGLPVSASITLTNGGLEKVHQAVLGVWDTTGVAADHYRLCVRVTTTTSSILEECSRVLVDPRLHPGWPRPLGLTWWSPEDHLTTADVDGDGGQDLLVGYGSKVDVLRHDGQSIPGWPRTVGGLTISGPTAGDLTGDGAPEVVAVNDRGDLLVWTSNGSPLIGWPKLRFLNGHGAVAIEDLEGDGIMEIVAVDSGFAGEGRIRVLDRDGNERAGWPQSPGWGPLNPPSVGDVDGDGTKEIVVSSRLGPTYLAVFRNDGTPLAGWPRTINPNGSATIYYYSYPVLADLTGDGDLEIVIGSADGKVFVFHHDGTSPGGWPFIAPRPVIFNPPALGDLDGDGVPEIVIGGRDNLYDNYLYALRYDGTVLSGWPQTNDTFVNYFYFGYGSPVVVDLDGDGRSEVVASSDVDADVPFALNGYRSTGAVATGFPIPTLTIGAGPTNTPAISDLDGDGFLEMAWIDGAYELFVWDLDTPASAAAPWPMYHRDARQTGALPSTYRRLTVTVTGVSGGRGTVSRSGSGALCNNLTGGSSRTCATHATLGSVVTLTASPAVDSLFLEWSGDCTGTGACSVDLSAPRFVTATFRPSNLPPVAEPGGPYTGTKNQPVTFNGSGSFDPEGAALTYSWNFGDQTAGTGVSPAHTYTSGGTFTVTLTVSDGSRSASKSTTAAITDPVPPGAVSTLAVSASNNRSVTLTWNATGDDGLAGTAYQYDLRYGTAPTDDSNFGSAFQVQGELPPKAPGSPETLKVSALLPGTTYYFAIKVLDKGGNASALSNVVSVTTAAGLVLFRDDLEAGPGSWTVTGTDGKGGPSLWHLSPYRFNSPSTAFYYGLEPAKTYNTGARNLGAIASKPIRLVGAKKPWLTFQHSLRKELGSSSYDRTRVFVALDGTESWALLREFTTPNTTWTEAEIDLSAYARNTIKLKLDFDTVDSGQNDYEGWIVDDITVTAEDVGPVAHAGGPYTAFKRQLATFDGSGSVDPEGDPLTYTWEFGDGAIGSGVNPMHAYAAAGTYNLRLTVSDGVKVSDPETAAITVTNRAPVANPAGPYTSDKGQPVSFDGSQSLDPDGDSLTYSWNFGDSTTGSGVGPTHAYSSVGTYTVTLTVSDGSASASKPATATITDPVPPGAVSTLAVSASNNRSVTLTWTSTGDDGLVGTAYQYDLRYSTAPIDESSFGSAFRVQGEASPKAPGSSETFKVSALLPGTTYYFGLKVLDKGGNASAISNTVSVTTAAGLVLFRDDLEAGPGNWTVSGSDRKGGPSLWHLSSYRFNSPSTAFYYGAESTKTYVNGAKNYGAIVSKPIRLVGAKKPYLTFQYALDKEFTDFYDQARLWVSVDGGVSWVIGRGFSVQKLMTGGEFNLSAYSRNTIQIKLEFEVDLVPANAYEGWIIDDFMVTAEDVGPIAHAGGPYTTFKYRLVEFDGSGSLDPEGDPLYYAWDFGDGTKGSDRRPTHSYSAAGTYTVSLTVTDGVKVSDPATTTVTVTNRAPTAKAGGPYSGDKLQPVSFDGRYSSDPDGDPLTYAWSFGDGTTGTGVSLAHVYQNYGTFNVTLTVSDGSASHSNFTTAAIVDRVPPGSATDLAAAVNARRSAALSWIAPGDDGYQGTALQYDVRYATFPLDAGNFSGANQVTGEPIPKAAGSAESMTVAGLAPGTTYYFGLKTRDRAGNFGDLSNVATVTTRPEINLFSENFESGLGRWTITGTNGLGGPALWHLSSSRYASPSKALYYGIDASRTYDSGAANKGEASSIAIDLHGARRVWLYFQHFLFKETFDRAKLLVSVEGGPWSELATFTGTPLAMTPHEMSLAAYEGKKIRLQFSFDTINALQNRYEGWYVDDVEVAAEFVNSAPIASSGGPYTGVRNAPVSFDGTGSSDPDRDLLTCHWDFGDGATGTGATPAHEYTSLGTYTVSLVVSDGTDTSLASTTTVSIANRAPVARSGGPYSGVRNEPVALDGAGSSDPDFDPLTYQWTFGDGGDGTTGTGATPAHEYTSLGTYTVSLVVSDGTDTSPASTTTVSIVNRAPVARSGGPYSGVRNEPVALDGAGSSDPDFDPLTYQWDFGDGATGTGATPLHEYRSLGTHTVSLIVSDGRDTALASMTTVTILNLPPSVRLAQPADGSLVTAPEPIDILAEASDPDGSVSRVEFFEGSNLLGATLAGPYAFRFLGAAPDVHVLTARVTDDSGESATSAPATVLVNAPPAVTLTGPAAGTIVAAPASVNLTADASDGDGSITRVEFFEGSQSLGVATTSPYSLTWTGVPPGRYRLTARATDDRNAVSVSSGADLVVTATLPPTADAYVRDGSNANRNFGAETTLQVKLGSSGNTRWTCFKFDLSAVPSVERAILRLLGKLSATTSGTVTASVFPASDTAWVESQINWNNRPPPGQTALSAVTLPNSTTASWQEWDVTQYLRAEKAAGRNVVTLVLKNAASSSPHVVINSKEAATGKPELKITP